LTPRPGLPTSSPGRNPSQPVLLTLDASCCCDTIASQILAYHVVPNLALRAAQLSDGEVLTTAVVGDTLTVRSECGKIDHGRQGIRASRACSGCGKIDHGQIDQARAVLGQISPTCKTYTTRLSSSVGRMSSRVTAKDARCPVSCVHVSMGAAARSRVLGNPHQQRRCAAGAHPRKWQRRRRANRRPAGDRRRR
jgi:hypothetical protein